MLPRDLFSLSFNVDILIVINFFLFKIGHVYHVKHSENFLSISKEPSNTKNPPVLYIISLSYYFECKKPSKPHHR